MHDHDQPANPTPDPHAGDASPEVAARVESTSIRSLADGELTDVESTAANSAAADPAAFAAGVAFERGLREAVGRTMGRDTAPAGLRERVMAAMAADSATSVGDAPAGSRDRAASRFGILGRLFHGPREADWLAVAAVVMLVAAVIAFSVLAPNVDDFGGGGSGPGVPLVVNEAADFAVREHVGCGNDSTRARKFGEQPMAAAEAARVLADRLDVASDRFAIPDLAHLGYEFRGLSACAVPGCGNEGSCHLLYRRGDGAMMSVFVVRDGRRYGAGRQDCVCDERGKRVVKVEQGGLAWFFVCCIERDLDRAADDFLAAVDRL